MITITLLKMAHRLATEGLSGNLIVTLPIAAWDRFMEEAAEARKFDSSYFGKGDREIDLLCHFGKLTVRRGFQ